MEKTCPHCERKFLPHPAVLNQQYCSNSECQKMRKRKWQKEKLANDPEYRDNQAAAQKDGAAGIKVTGRSTGRGTLPMRERNRLCTEGAEPAKRSKSQIAKMDESGAKTIIASGRYRLVPLYNGGLQRWTSSS